MFNNVIKYSMFKKLICQAFLILNIRPFLRYVEPKYLTKFIII